LAYLCANKCPIGLQWSPVDSYRNKGGRVKPSKQGFVKQDDLKEAAVLPEVDGGAGEKKDDFGMVL